MNSTGMEQVPAWLILKLLWNILSRGMRLLGGLQRDPCGWQRMFLHPEGSRGMGEDVPASHSLIPHPKTRSGPGNPRFDLPNLCGTQVSRDGCLLPFMLFQTGGSRIPESLAQPHPKLSLSSVDFSPPGTAQHLCR